jgi:ATP-dependent DNA ligase
LGLCARWRPWTKCENNARRNLAGRLSGKGRAARRPTRKTAPASREGAVVFQHACKMGLEGIVSKRLGSRYRSGRSPDWLKFKNPDAPAVKREAEEDWGKRLDH